MENATDEVVVVSIFPHFLYLAYSYFPNFLYNHNRSKVMFLDSLLPITKLNFQFT